jgi:ABC-type Fe3+-hydroxamate transport system substrate-binding protein
MHLSTPSAAPASPRRTVSLSLFVVGIIVAAGVSIAGASAYYAFRASPPAGPVSVTDDLGRTVSIPNDPARAVVLGPSIMDSMYRLGLRAHVVGVDCYAPSLGGLSSDYSSDQVALWNLTSSMCVEVEPSFSAEALLALGPQLVLAAGLVPIGAVEQFSDTYHVPVVFLQPATLSGIAIDVELLGEIFGVTAAATSLATSLQGELERAASLQSNLTANATPFPTVLVTYYSDTNGYWTYGPGTFGESLIELASGTSISANATSSFPELSGEQVLASDPEFIVYGVGFGLNESSYSGGPFWTQLAATQDGHADGVDSNYFTEPDPTMVLVGLPAMITVLHPGSA